MIKNKTFKKIIKAILFLIWFSGSIYIYTDYGTIPVVIYYIGSSCYFFSLNMK